MNILVIGSINMDLLMITDRLPHPGESMISELYEFNPGGKGANQVAAAALLGADATFAGKVGGDDFGKVLKQTLEDLGVCTKFLTVSESNKSGFAVIMLEDNGQNRIIVHRAANLDLDIKDIDDAFKQHYDGVIVGFEVSEEVVIHACKLAKSKNIPTIVDAGPAQAFPLNEIYGIDILSPNETETQALCGVAVHNDQDCLEASKILMERSGAKYIVLKLGAMGASLYDGSNIVFFPAHKVSAVDVTSAGDVFTAALALKYTADKDIENAVRYANIAGALTVTKLGAMKSIPAKKDVDNVFGVAQGHFTS